MFRAMGYLTTITIRNDSLHVLQKNPLEFAQAVFDGMIRANREHKEVSAGLKGECNPIEIHPSRHADDTTVYVHYGNCVFNLNPYNDDMKELIERNPDCAESFLNVAEQMVKLAKRKIKEKRAK